MDFFIRISICSGIQGLLCKKFSNRHNHLNIDGNRISVAINMAFSMLGDASAGFGTGLLTSLTEIIFSVGVGVLFGWIFNFLAHHLKIVSEGAYIILIIGGPCNAGICTLCENLTGNDYGRDHHS